MPRGLAARLATALLAVASVSACTLSPHQIERDAANLPPRIELERVPFHPQEQYQCGPAALATVLNASELRVSPDELAPEVYLPGKKGSLQVELIAAARARDRLVYPIDPSLKDVLTQVAGGHPVLVLQNLALKSLPAWHFAVVVGYDREADQVILRSGTTRRAVMDAGRFMRTWDRAQRWAVLVLQPDQLPATPDLQRYIAAAAGLEATGRLDAAERAYARARAQWPDSSWPALGLANINYARGDKRSAEQRYREAIELDPRNVVASNNLAELLGERGCSSAAHVHIARALELAKGTSLENAVTETWRKIANGDEHDANADCPES